MYQWRSLSPGAPKALVCTCAVAPPVGTRGDTRTPLKEVSRELNEPCAVFPPPTLLHPLPHSSSLYLCREREAIDRELRLDGGPAAAGGAGAVAQGGDTTTGTWKQLYPHTWRQQGG